MVFLHNLSSASRGREGVEQEWPLLVATAGQDRCQPCQETQCHLHWRQPQRAESPLAVLFHCFLHCSHGTVSHPSLSINDEWQKPNNCIFLPLDDNIHIRCNTHPSRGSHQARRGPPWQLCRERQHSSRPPYLLLAILLHSHS